MVLRTFPMLFCVLVLQVIVVPRLSAAPERPRGCTEVLETLPSLEGWRFSPGDDPGYAEPAYDDAAWGPIQVPAIWERQGFGGLNGFGWYRVHFDWRGPLPCRPVGLRLGGVDDIDQTFLNGVLIGQTGELAPQRVSRSSVRRIYAVPLDLIRPGENVLAVRVFDIGGRGGIDQEQPRLGDLQTLMLDVPAADFIPRVAPIMFVLVGFYHLLLFVYQPRARHNLYFFGFSLGVAGLVFNRSQLPGLLYLHPGLIRELSWVGTFASAPLLLGFVHAHFGLEVPRWIRLPVVLLGVLALSSPFIPGDLRYTLFFYLGQPAILALIGHIMGMVVQAARAGRRDAIWLGAGLFLLAATSIVEILANLVGWPDPALLPGGVSVFMLMVVALVARREVGRTRELELSAAALRDLNQTLEHQVAERTRHLEEARSQLVKRNELLGEFNALVSHDLKAPMRGLEVVTEFLETDYRGRLGDEGQRLLDLIRDATRQMRALLDGLMSLAQLDGGGEAAVVPLNAVVEAVRGLLAGQLLTRNARLEVVGSLPEVVGHHARLTEVISNLVSNGVKYNLNDAPRVEVAVATREEIAPEGLGRREVCIRVTDNGIGIPEEYQQQIFEPFRRLHSSDEFEGSGIGLAIVRKAIRQMHGRIWLRSRAGQGTTFYFTLPTPDVDDSQN